MTVTTTALPIPEPATATLSLLALCGLAARRQAGYRGCGLEDLPG
ncbi:MAG: PEP-CTERM sorting domain-containing protein [Akkermansia sp.]|nr:PEP-CTERM sorting domain-containing protein [Akkermansia sp.]